MAPTARYNSCARPWLIIMAAWRDPLTQCLAPRLSRLMATETSLPRTSRSSIEVAIQPKYIPPPVQRRVAPTPPEVLTTVYSFPSMEPKRYAYYPANHLHLPLRKDILHRAVVFEGDAARQGTASTKWRGDVHGSHRKMRSQKGVGKARIGDRQSPAIRGGGVVFGPHPRDLSTDLPRKIYDLAWRTALSYRYRTGQLVVLENGIEIEMGEPRWLAQIMDWNHLGKQDGGALVVARHLQPKISEAFLGVGGHGRLKSEDDVDVKDLLKAGRVMIEQKSLDALLRKHSTDLETRVRSAFIHKIPL